MGASAERVTELRTPIVPSWEERGQPRTFSVISAIVAVSKAIGDPEMESRFQEILRSSGDIKSLDENLQRALGSQVVNSLKEAVGQILRSPDPVAIGVLESYGYQPRVVKSAFKWTNKRVDPLDEEVEVHIDQPQRLSSPPWSSASRWAGRRKGPGRYDIDFRIAKKARRDTRKAPVLEIVQ